MNTTEQLNLEDAPFDGTQGGPIAGQLVPLSPDEIAVFAVIRRAEGREQAVPMPDVAALCGLSTRVVQEIVKHLIEAHAMPIGSATGTPHGYYWITDAEDLDQAKTQLRNRIIHVARRLKALDRNALHEVMGQIRLELNEAS